MNHIKRLLNNDQGFILVLSMITMVALTVIGISGTSNTSIEVQIAGNERHYNQAFYASEAGWQHGIQAIEKMANAPNRVNQFDQDDPDDPENDLVDQVSNQALIVGETSYNYKTYFVETYRLPGFSGSGGWKKFRYSTAGTGSGLRNSEHESMAIVEKPFETGY